MRTGSNAHLLGLLVCLYLAQGLPSGLIAHALPTLMRDAGASLSAIGLTGLLALPWALKFLWAPVLERWGTRKRWLLLLNLSSLSLMLVLASRPLEAWFAPTLLPLFTCLALLNLVAATQDIATDGLAVSRLVDRLRGVGNSIQVIGYKAGMILGGSLLLVWVDQLGWRSAYLMLCGIFALAIVPVLFMDGGARQVPAHEHAGWKGRAGYAGIFQGFVRRPGMGWWLLVVATFKIGDSLASGMVRPLLVDRGVSLSDIGLMSGTVGAACGVIGAVVGGVLLLRVGHRNALMLFGMLQAMGLFAYTLVAAGLDDLFWLFALVAFEQFADGLSTVALFTIMMDVCRKGHPSSDYTLQASLLVIATGVARLGSGFVAEGVGYGMLFTLAGALTIAALLPVLLYFRSQRLLREG